MHTAPSFHETKEQNALEEKTITIFLSNKYLDTPYPIRCLSCGFTIFGSNNEPHSIIMGKIEPADAKRSIDIRCKKCKITFRII